MVCCELWVIAWKYQSIVQKMMLLTEFIIGWFWDKIMIKWNILRIDHKFSQFSLWTSTFYVRQDNQERKVETLIKTEIENFDIQRHN